MNPTQTGFLIRFGGIINDDYDNNRLISSIIFTTKALSYNIKSFSSLQRLCGFRFLSLFKDIKTN